VGSGIHQLNKRQYLLLCAALSLCAQAADLRYIIEAPKLEISKEERVEIPLITSDTWRQKE
jgi:hypothetical protein